MDPEKKSLNFIFPTKYVIPKSLKFSHWPSKTIKETNIKHHKDNTLANIIPIMAWKPTLTDSLIACGWGTTQLTSCLDVQLEVRINGDRINGLFHLVINGVYWGEITHLLTIDPNFLGHPSSD